MKQRLLLALLMLFSSVGFMKAQTKTIDIAVPKGNETVTVTLTSDKSSFNKDDYPTYVPNDAVTHKFGTKSVIYTIKQNKDKPVEFKINTAAYDWGKITLNLKGKVTSFYMPSTPGVLCDKITTLVFTDNTELTSLNLEGGKNLETLNVSGNSKLTSILNWDNLVALKSFDASSCGYTAIDLTKQTKLETLLISKNKLTTISNPPASLKTLDITENGYAGASGRWNLSTLTNLTTLKMDGNKLAVVSGLPTTCTVTWGTQDLTEMTNSYSEKANDVFDMNEFVGNFSPDLKNEVFSFEGSGWKYKDDHGEYQGLNYNPAHQLQAGNKNAYKFYNGQKNNAYVSGTYEATLVGENNKKLRVRFTIKPATFKIKVTQPTQGEIKIVRYPNGGVVESEQTVLTQGDLLSIGWKEVKGYEFETFKDYKALNLYDNSQWDKNPVVCQVEGCFTSLGQADLAPEISASVKGSARTITINNPDVSRGKITVQKKAADGSLSIVNSGDKIATGTELVVKVEPAASYSGTLLVNGKDKSVSDKSNYYEVSGIMVEADLNIAASFEQVKTVTITALVDNMKLSESGVSVNSITFRKGSENKVLNNTSNNKVSLQVGAEYQLEFKVNTGSILREILFDAKAKMEYTTSGANTYFVASFVPEQDGTIYIHTVKQNTITIAVNDLESSTQTQTYDGKQKPLIVTTDPVGFEDKVKVVYQLSSGAAYGEDAPTNAGPYSVKYSLPAENISNTNYKPFSEKIVTLIIKKATPLFATVPTVTLKDGNYKMEKSDGVVKFGNHTLTGEFSVKDPGTFVDKTKSHLVEVEFKPTGADATNYNTVKVQTECVVDGKPMDKLAIQLQTPGVDVKLYEGDKATKLTTFGTKYAEGTKLILLVSYPETAKAENVKVQDPITKAYLSEYPNLSNEQTCLKAFSYTVPAMKTGVESVAFKVEIGDLAGFEHRIEFEKQKTAYQVTPVKYYTKNLRFSKDIDDSKSYSAPTKYTLTYKTSDGKDVILPEAVGVYNVYVHVPADLANGYVEKTYELKGALEITKALPMVKAWPEARPIAKGQSLKWSQLVAGSANISGTFTWENESVVPTKTGDKFVVVFTPDDKKNYEVVKTPRGTEDAPGTQDERVPVTICDYQVVMVNQVQNGIVLISDANGKRYNSGDRIDPNTKLYINATAADGYRLVSLKVNGKEFDPDQMYNAGENSVTIEAAFEETSEVPQYQVTFDQVDGAIVGGYTNNGWVNKGDKFSFTVDVYSADLAKLVVSVNGKVLTRENGKYTIKSVQADTHVKISLPNPTSLKVTVPAEYKDKDGNLIGTVSWTGGSTNCYYGETVQLTATPEAGVEFKGWKGLDFASTSKIVNFPVYRNMEIEAVFEGEAVVVDPDKECTVKLPTMGIVNGVSLNKDGVQIVEKGGKFEFEVLTYKDDKDKLVVKANGVVLKPGEDGKTYTLPEVKENTTIEISLPNPTRLKVRVPGEIKNDKGYLLGRVEVYGLNSDSTCLYNEMIQLVAYPETGVKFSHWSDDKTKTASFRELYVLDNMEIKAVFEGTPTGIEDIMAASIATGKGCVWVRGIANADVTIVSIAGRVQARQRISGDTRIDVPAGIYVVVLESGSDVKRVKVIVK